MQVLTNRLTIEDTQRLRGQQLTIDERDALVKEWLAELREEAQSSGLTVELVDAHGRQILRCAPPDHETMLDALQRIEHTCAHSYYADGLGTHSDNCAPCLARYGLGVIDELPGKSARAKEPRS